MSSTIETSYSRSATYSTTKMISRRDQNGNFVRTHRDSSLPPPIRKSKVIPESPVSLQQPIPPPRKHVSISQSDLQGYPYDNRVYTNETIYNQDRQLPLRSSYRPPSRQSHLQPNSNLRNNSNYEENLSYHYASRRAVNPLRLVLMILNGGWIEIVRYILPITTKFWFIIMFILLLTARGPIQTIIGT